MQYDDKRKSALTPAEIQKGNQAWWTSQTMSYDWNDRVGVEKFSLPWYDEIDRRFLHASRLFSSAANPYEEMMGTANLAGKRVLEIGCGMGFHSEMLARAGADLVSIDLSPTSVESTQRRLKLKDLTADIRQMDAEKLDFPDHSFDMVWSWGVIHHSSRTGRIVRHIERILKPGGTARIMVYNLNGMPAYVALTTRYVTGFWRRRELDEILWRSTDGFSARFYTKDLWDDLLLTFFDGVETTVLGADADAVPLPNILRRHALKLVSEARQRQAIRRRGAFLFSVASKAG